VKDDLTSPRREFLSASSVALLGLAVQGSSLASLAAQGSGLASLAADGAGTEPVIDIHQHLGYSGRPDAVLLAHQHVMGVTTTILLPAGRPVNTPSTHGGVSNGLQAEALGNEACLRFARAHARAFRCGANEVPDVQGATREIERYLKRGAVVIAEQKFGVECDAPEMQRLYELAQDYRVPVLMHWQFEMYNYGFERFYKMLDKYSKVNFLGHAQTWWANIDKNHRDQSVLYPKGPVAPGGLTDRYLTDYPNMFGNLSAGSGLNALTRDEDFTRDFLTRHQDKLLYGSDCSDHEGAGPKCQGAQTLAAVRRLATGRVERKLLHENAKRLFRLPAPA
jgi:predicted TIM-barrel fold metal-dependent hydrolase